MYKLAIAVVTALTIASTTACSGSSKGTAPVTTSTKPATANSTTTTSAPDSPIANLAAKTASANVKINYSSALGVSATIIQNGLGNSAFISGGTLLISNGDTVVQCNGTTAAATCTDLGPTGPEDALTQVIATYASLSTLTQSDIGVTSTQTIAGRSASCVTFKAADYAAGLGSLADSNKLTAAATVTVCIDDDSGFALKVALTDRGQTVNEVLATQVGTPTPSDFVPPSAPVPLPSTTTTTPAG
jgi:hypothetical protein